MSLTDYYSKDDDFDNSQEFVDLTNQLYEEKGMTGWLWWIKTGGSKKELLEMLEKDE